MVDCSFLDDATQGFCSHTGQPPPDPVVRFKLVLVGRLKNLVSDRRLVAPCALRLDLLLFPGYEVDEALPWHSTVSRTRQLFPAGSLWVWQAGTFLNRRCAPAGAQPAPFPRACLAPKNSPRW